MNDLNSASKWDYLDFGRSKEDILYTNLDLKAEF